MKEKIIILLSLLLFIGCEDFLDEEPVGKVSEKNFYRNINDFQLALNSVYNVLSDESFQKAFVLIGDGMSDDFVYQKTRNNDFGDDGDRLQNFIIYSDNNWVATWYNQNYKGIYRANQLLKNIHNDIPLAYVPDVEDDQIKIWQYIYGQVLFLRAYYYFNLVQVFGGISIVPENIDIEEVAIPRATKEEVYEYIEKDLRTASILLPGNSEFGTVDNYAGLSMLLKVLVTQSKHGVSSSKWDEAAQIGRVLCIHGNAGERALTYNDILKLEEHYPEMTWDEWKNKFKYDLWTNENANKAQLNMEGASGVFRSTSDMASRHGFYDWTRLWRLSYQNLNDNTEPIFVVPSMEIKGVNPNSLDLYNKNDNLYSFSYKADQAFIPSISLVNLMTTREGIDPRNNYGCYSHGAQPNGSYPEEFRETFGGILTENFHTFVKYFLINETERPNVFDNTSSPRNYIIMRYSDLVLLYAEALNETGNQVAAIDIINDLRDGLRTVKKLDNTFPYTIDYGPYVYVRDRIRLERRKELAGERVRYFDLLRYGNAGDAIKAAYDKIETATSKQNVNFIKGIHELLPIPQAEIELSHGIIEQNKGY